MRIIKIKMSVWRVNIEIDLLRMFHVLLFEMIWITNND